MRTICVITGSRAEYGLLRWVMQGIKDDPELQLKVIATGAHLSPEFGHTYQAIEQDGFRIDRKVEMLTSSDTSVGIAKSMGLGLIGFADALHEEQPNLIVVLGDRFEIFVAAQAAMALQIPVAHLAGGDNGAGTFDNIIRHCITKIASLHFVTHEEARRRVIQLGESPERVFCFGATSVENIVRIPLLSREELERELDIKLEQIVLLVTFHPLTMDQSSAEDELQCLLNVLERFQRELKCSVVFTKANSDNGGRELNALIEYYVQQNNGSHLYDSLGQLRYLSMMKHASVVIGNSSSGIYEAPYLQTPTVDIGSRQRGRLAPASVLRCDADEDSISRAIRASLLFIFDNVEMVYGEADASILIVAKLKELINVPGLFIKTFCDLETTK